MSAAFLSFFHFALFPFLFDCGKSGSSPLSTSPRLQQPVFVLLLLPQHFFLGTIGPSPPPR